MNDYLDKMGIERWRLRSLTAEPETEPETACRSLTPPIFCYYLGQPPLVALLADADSENNAQQELLLAIVKAMGQTFTGGYLKDGMTEVMPDSVKAMVFIGQPVASVVELAKGKSSEVVVTRSLAAMLQDTALKAHTWRDLQAVMRSVGW